MQNCLVFWRNTGKHFLLLNSCMTEVFVTKDEPFDLRGSNTFVLPRARTNFYGIDTVRFLSHNMISSYIKIIICIKL